MPRPASALPAGDDPREDVGMVTVERSHSRHTGRRVLAWSAIGLTALCAAGYAAQRAAATRDARRYPPPGRLVDLGSVRLHLDVHGEGRGAPTVVLEAGLGSFSPN